MTRYWKLAVLAIFAPSAFAAIQVTAACPMPSATLAQPYSFQITFTGAVGAVNFSPNGLPSGLTVNQNGFITGTPTEAGYFQFSVQIVDSTDTSAVYNCSLLVTGPITITSVCPAPTGVFGVPYSFALTATDTATAAPPPGPLISPPLPTVGGGINLGYELGNPQLPPGINFDANTGVFSGTPTATGSFLLDAFAFDMLGNSAHYRCQFDVKLFLLTAPCPAASGMFGVSYSFSVSVLTATQLVWSLQSGSLPPGLSLNSATGLISGIPTAPGTYPFSISISPPSAAANFSVTYSCAISIGAPPIVITTSCPISTLPATLTATGGVGNLVFSIGGSLPAGVVLRGNTLFGSLPTDPGNYLFTLIATDGFQMVQKPCGIVVNPPPVQITSGCAAFPIPQGSPASFTLAATGGPDPNYSWSIIGNLPAGLKLTGNVISGTVTAPPGKYDFVVQVTSGLSTASIPCSIVVSDPQLHITSSCPGNGTVGVPYGPFVLTATGGLGAGTYKFSVSGNLPSGVNLSGDTISGTPDTPGRYLFTLNVNSGQQTVSLAPCSVVIAATTLQISANCPGSPIPAGTPVSIPLSATGGKAPYKFSLSGPAWLSLDSSNAITGTPAATDRGQAAIVATVTDASGATATFRCSITVTPAPLQVTGACPGNPVAPGSPISFPFSATGGVPPYTWSISGNSGLSLSANQGATNSVAGNAPTTVGNYSFAITLSDNANSTPATRSCNLAVQLAPLQISGSCPSASLSLPASLSIPLSASGGKEPYSWKFTGPSWIGLSATSGASTTLASSAAPDTAGPFSFSVTLSDSANSIPAVLACDANINVPPTPPVSFTGFTPSGSLLTPVNGGLTVSPAPLLPLTGVVQLSFTPNAFGVTDNPQVVFQGGGRTATFSIAAGQTSFSLPAVQQGTVAGTIHLEVVSLKEGNVDVLATPHPSIDLTVPRLAPTIDATQVSFANETANGFDVIISGFSTPRDIKSVVLTFAPSSGATLNGTTSFTVDVTSVFSQYYSSSASQLVGSMFQNLDIPISVNGDKTAIGSVTVVLTNSVGNSTSVTKSRQ